MTEKLYWADPTASTFEASAVTLARHEGKPSLVLARTLFYPEGGGQLGDTGTLDAGGRSLAIVDTQVVDDGTIHHILADEPSSEDRAALAGAVVSGTVDFLRRRDHMVQHTAQHALSRALADVARAETVSARLGASSCTIDVARSSIPDTELHRAEDLVNALVASNVEVRALYPERAELAALPLRKQPKVDSGVIRIIDIDGFDMTPCGGTHCTRSGQIGQARFVGFEKHKGMLRLTFHAGLRALADARTKHRALTAVATDLTCGLADVPGAITKLRSDLKGTRAQLDAARAELADLLARHALSELDATNGGPIVIAILRPADDMGTLRLLAGKLTADPRVVAVVGALDPTTAELAVVLQRGESAKLDCGVLLQARAKELSGRGGGRPERAEGRFPKNTALDDLATAARAALA